MRNRIGWQSAVLAIAVVVMPRAVKAEDVRSSSPAIASLLARGLEESSTFQTIVQTIQASNAIVYVERGDCRAGVRGCLKG